MRQTSPPAKAVASGISEGTQEASGGVGEGQREGGSND